MKQITIYLKSNIFPKPNNSKNLNTNLLAQKLIDILYKYKK